MSNTNIMAFDFVFILNATYNFRTILIDLSAVVILLFFICDCCCVLCEKFADYLLLCSLCKILIAAQSSASKTIRVVIV